MAGFTGPIGFGNLGRPGAPTIRPSRIGPPRMPGNALSHSYGNVEFKLAQMRANANRSKPSQATNTAPGQAPSSTPGQPSPLDSTYYNNVAGNNFKVGNDINGLNLQNGLAGTALQSALAQLAYQQPRDELRLEQGANARGGLFSSVYDQNLGNLNYQYAGKQGGAIDRYGGEMMTNAAKIAALQGGVPLFDQQQAIAAAGRASTQAANNPAVGSGVPTGGASVTGGTAPGRPSGRGGTPPRVPAGPLSRSYGNVEQKLGPRLAGQGKQPSSHRNGRIRQPPRKGSGSGVTGGRTGPGSGYFTGGG